MLKITYKNTIMQLDPDCTLLTFLTSINHTTQGSAVAINRKFIPATDYHQTTLQNNDQIEIITPMQGG